MAIGDTRIQQMVFVVKGFPGARAAMAERPLGGVRYELEFVTQRWVPGKVADRPDTDWLLAAAPSRFRERPTSFYTKLRVG